MKAKAFYLKIALGVACSFIITSNLVYSDTQKSPTNPIEESSRTESAETQDESEDISLSDETQLELAKIRLLLEKEECEKALERLELLSKTHPNSLEIFLMQANAEHQLGQWISALHTINKAEKKYPENKDLKNLRKDILFDHREYISLEGEYKKTGSIRKQYFSILEGKVRVNPLTYLNFDLQNNSIDAKTMTRPKSGNTVSKKVHRQKADLSLEHFFNDTHSVKAGLYGAQSIVGAHASYTLNDKKGRTTLAARLRRPNWDYSETVIFSGSQDSLSLKRFFKFTKAFTLSLEGNLNNYNVDGLSSIAKSLTLLGRVAYTFFSKNGYALLPGKNSSIGLAYTLDSEHPYRVKKRVNSTGDRYSMLGISRTETHGFEIFASTFLTPQLELSAYGGYTVTRFEKNNPFAGANLHYTLKDKIRFGLEYSHTVESSDQSETTDRLRLKATYFFT